MRHIMFDIETLDVESTAVVLSIAMIEFKLDETPTYQELLNRAAFVKFNVHEQILKYKRTVNQSTVDWWKKRSKLVREVSLKPRPDDVSVLEGLEILRQKAGCRSDFKRNNNVMFWARGGLDQTVFESLCRSVGQTAFTHYSNWRDVRTAVELLVEGAVHGYVEVPLIHQDAVAKHDPRCDCAYDIMQLLLNNYRGKESE